MKYQGKRSNPKYNDNIYENKDKRSKKDQEEFEMKW